MKTTLVLTVIATLALAGCGKRDAAHGPTSHAHTAPHGGTLVEVGEHAYSLEFVHDPAQGKLSAYILDGHVENFVRIDAPSLQIEATLPDGAKHTLTLAATANSATGESVGDTAQFEGQAEWLKSARKFEVALPVVTIKGTAFLNLAFNLPKGSPKE